MSITVKHIILSFLIALLSISLLAQEYQLEVNHLSSEDGLSSRKVNMVCQDTFGFIWMATENGLNRYDGHTFKQYFSNTSGLRKNDIREVHADQQGRIWCIHHKKYKKVIISENLPFDNLVIDIFDLHTASFQSFDSLSPIGEKNIVSFFKAPDGKLYFSTIDGEIFDCADLSQPFISLPKDRPFFNFVLTKNGVWTNEKKRLSFYSFEGQLQSEENIDFQALRLDYRNEETIWVSPMLKNPSSNYCGELYVKSRNKPVYLYGFDLKDKPIHRWHEDRMVMELKDQLEVHIYQGMMYLYHSGKGQVLEELKLAIPSLDYLPYIRRLFKDRTGVVWISTAFGVFSIDVIDKKFKTFLTGKSVRSIFQLNKDSLMVFTYSGVFIKNESNNETKKLANTRYKRSGFVGVTKDAEGDFWAGSHSSHIVKISPHGKVIDDYYFPLYQGKIFTQLHFPCYDSLTSKLWLASTKGLFELDQTARERIPFLDHQGEEVFREQHINTLSIDEAGIWVMSRSGFYLINENKEVTEILWNNQPFVVCDMYKDEEGIRWLTIIDNGILRWDPAKEEMIHISTNQGLSNNNVYTVQEDDYGYLWLPSDYGLMRMNKQDFSVQAFFVEDGIAHNEFNHTSAFKDTSGTFYFGGLNGVTYFDPADFVEPSTIDNRPIVTSLLFTKRGGKALDDRTALLRREKSITLKTDDQSFVLEMTTANYEHMGKQTFAYQIEGLENTWTEIRENFVRINRLPYGYYNILLKARHLGGQWSSRILTIPLHVERPLYLKPWFLGLLVLTILILTGLTIHWRLMWLERDKGRLEKEVELRTKKIEEQKTELEALNRTKDQFFAIIAHDLRGPVISFRGLSKKVNFLIRRKQIERLNDLGTSIDHAASNLEKLLDNLLNWALIQDGSLPYHPKMVNIQLIINEALNVFQGTYESKLITINLELEEDLEVYADTNGLSAIIRNLLSNAIKYSAEGGSILIATKREDGYGMIQFEDQGRGMEEELIHKILKTNTPYIPSIQGSKGEVGTGLGLKLCKQLIELHQGSLEIYNRKPERGLIVCARLPVDQF